MYLRKLKLKDAPLILSLMHDESVADRFKLKTIKDCENFISAAQDMTNDAHFAIASDEDEYMGMVSLGHIDRTNSLAECTIAVRKESMGRGYSWFGMEEIIERAFSEFGLESIYWCVPRNNTRAVRFFDKHNFHESLDITQEILKRYEGTKNLKWYSALKGDVLDERTIIVGCKIIHIKTIPTVNSGELSFYEATHDIPFVIKRNYYISKVPEGVRRGFHAHKELSQLLYCPYGKIQLILENELGREEIELSDPSIGVVIERPTWREMLWLQKDSVLCVAASDFYKEEDYIRDYDEFQEYIKEKHK